MSVLTKKHKASSSETAKRIYDFLHTHPIGVLASVDPNDDPHAVVIYFAINESFEITFTTKSETKKHSDLQLNPRAMLVVYDAASQTTVQVASIAEMITDYDETQQTIRSTIGAAFKMSEAGLPPIAKLKAGEFVAYKLKPKQIRMAVFARPDPGDYSMYEVLDF